MNTTTRRNRYLHPSKSNGDVGLFDSFMDIFDQGALRYIVSRVDIYFAPYIASHDYKRAFVRCESGPRFGVVDFLQTDLPSSSK